MKKKAVEPSKLEFALMKQRYVLCGLRDSPRYLQVTSGVGCPVTRHSIKASVWMAGCWLMGACVNSMSSAKSRSLFSILFLLKTHHPNALKLFVS